ncbi:uncharacterized protein LOC134833870 [Culicoides brevitarsis]|uniref:uncharacterized protein LOC134833870 n=1 Tax=Culicoides brevitarsis TaxID=469753 RepID=UPI00307C106E
MPPKDRLLEERQKRRRLARMRFKSLIRKTIVNNFWLQELSDQKLGDNVKRNVAIIMKRKGTKGLLSILDKAVLNIPADDRTPEQKRKLVPLLLDLPCFQRFPPVIRAQLASCTYFYFVNARRIILRQHHHASAVYFILNGEVNISKETLDNVTNERKEEIVGTYVNGDMFGEVAIMKNTKRIATISAETDCELLCIYREDFNRLLRPTLQRQWDQIQQAMSRFKYFSYWSTQQKEECCILSKIKQFSPNDIVYGDTGNFLNFSHFILSGQCMVLQCLKIKKRNGLTSKETKYELLPAKSKINEVDDPSTDFHFVDVGTMSAGAAFGLGENLEHRSIVAKTTVQCLLIPRYWLFQKAQNKGNLWERIKLYMDATIPSRETTFQDFLDTQKWKSYRKELVENVFANKKITNPTIYYDIPLVCRITGN